MSYLYLLLCLVVIVFSADWLVDKNVVRGRDWKWGDQDGGNGNVGIVRDTCEDGWVEVKWRNGKVGQYRWGNDNCFDLKVVPRDFVKEIKEEKEIKEMKEEKEIKEMKEEKEVKEDESSSSSSSSSEDD